jgi:hypothetical protein
MLKKIQHPLPSYLDKGTSQVWLMYPIVNEVYQYRRETPDIIHTYRGEQSLDVAPLLLNLMVATRHLQTP